MKCNGCGKENSPDLLVCAFCGKLQKVEGHKIKDETLVDELHAHLQGLGVECGLVSHRDGGHHYFSSEVLGSIELQKGNVDKILLKRRGSGGYGDPTYDLYYILDVEIDPKMYGETKKKTFYVDMFTKSEGFFKRKVLDIYWKAFDPRYQRYADTLNMDTPLKRRLLELKVNKQLDTIKIEQRQKNKFFQIVTTPDTYYGKYGIKFPTPPVLEAIDKIAGYLRQLAG